MSQLTIRNKILLGFVVIAIFGVVLGIIGLSTTARIITKTNELHEVVLGIPDLDKAHYDTIVAKENEILNISQTTSTTVLTLMVVMVAASIILSLSITRTIVGDINFLAKIMADLVKTGNFDIDSSIAQKVTQFSQRKGAIGQISASFNSLVDMMKRKLATLQEVAHGNLNTDIVHRSDKDSYGNAFQKMVDDLNDMFLEINDVTTQVSRSSEHIAKGSQMLASGSSQQAATMQQLSATISEITSKTMHNAKRTEQAAKLANTILGNAEKGNYQMEQMISAVDEINMANQNISKVIKAIDDIAFQTNILALNAAVEAARAGQAGKGFAVVAEEVRNLAAKSAESARETGTLISNSMEKAQLGTQIASETAVSLGEIVSGIGESASIIEEIASSSEEQNRAINQINTAINDITNFVTQNSSTAQESAAASQEMNSQASVLKELISTFTLKDSRKRLT